MNQKTCMTSLLITFVYTPTNMQTRQRRKYDKHACRAVATFKARSCLSVLSYLMLISGEGGEDILPSGGGLWSPGNMPGGGGGIKGGGGTPGGSGGGMKGTPGGGRKGGRAGKGGDVAVVRSLGAPPNRSSGEAGVSTGARWCTGETCRSPFCSRGDWIPEKTSLYSYCIKFSSCSTCQQP